MFQNIPFSTYFPGKSLLHRLRARTKLLLMLWLTIYFTIANQNFWDFASISRPCCSCWQAWRSQASLLASSGGVCAGYSCSL